MGDRCARLQAHGKSTRRICRRNRTRHRNNSPHAQPVRNRLISKRPLTPCAGCSRGVRPCRRNSVGVRAGNAEGENPAGGHRTLSQSQGPGHPQTDKRGLAELDLPVSSATMQIVHGAAGSALIRRYRSRRTDLIALGTHAGNAISQALMGSVARDLLRAAGCDVLVSAWFS